MCDFSDSRQIAFHGPLDQHGRNSAQRKGIAPKFNQERAVKRLSRFVEPIGRAMISSIGTIGLLSLLILSHHRFWN